MYKNVSVRLLRYPVLLMSMTAVLLLLGAVAFKEGATVNAAQQGTVVTLEVPDQTFAGEVISIKLAVNNAQNLAGFQSTLNYDSTNLQLTGATIEQDLTRSGRGLLRLGPVRRESALVLGAATCPVANCSDHEYDTAKRYPQGVDGYVELAKIDFYTEAPGQYQLKLANVKLVDPQGNELGATSVSVPLTVTTK
jgi:hypothetical protein